MSYDFENKQAASAIHLDRQMICWAAGDSQRSPRFQMSRQELSKGHLTTTRIAAYVMKWWMKIKTLLFASSVAVVTFIRSAWSDGLSIRWLLGRASVVLSAERAGALTPSRTSRRRPHSTRKGWRKRRLRTRNKPWSRGDRRWDKPRHNVKQPRLQPQQSKLHKTVPSSALVANAK